MATSYQYALSPLSQTSSYESRMVPNNEATSILVRKLPRNTSREALRTMLLFAKDLKEADFVPNEYDEDHGFLTAVARFENGTAASEAQAMLNGKPNPAGQANMIVEIRGTSPMSSLGRRNTIDHSSTRGLAQSVSPPLSNTQISRQSSRFNGTFQSMEKVSPPNIISSPIPDLSSPENGSHLQTIFAPQSPLGHTIHERSRISGKSVIDQDTADDDTGELLKDPVAYMQNDQSTSLPGVSRRSTNPQIPIARFSSLSLNTSMSPPTMSTYTSPRPHMTSHAAGSAMSPNMAMGNNPGYPGGNQLYHRHNYPPVNPADQNPPCNTLYVGNLPIDTSEDELKAMFSKQRGYKRLCFRTKQNGPMCFVEFEDVSFATKALNELYGVQLHNSVKGGIRLSFSKNPLGVRAGQPGSTNPSTPLSPQGPISGLNSLSPMSPGSFSTANGPPPGLSVPPGLGMHMGVNGPSMANPMTSSHMNGAFVNNGLGIGTHGMNSMRGMPINGAMGATSSGPVMGSVYPDYMMGR